MPMIRNRLSRHSRAALSGKPWAFHCSRYASTSASKVSTTAPCSGLSLPKIQIRALSGRSENGTSIGRELSEYFLTSKQLGRAVIGQLVVLARLGREDQRRQVRRADEPVNQDILGAFMIHLARVLQDFGSDDDLCRRGHRAELA